jgi:hypothetical protein
LVTTAYLSVNIRAGHLLQITIYAAVYSAFNLSHVVWCGDGPNGDA